MKRHCINEEEEDEREKKKKRKKKCGTKAAKYAHLLGSQRACKLEIRITGKGGKKNNVTKKEN